MYKALKPFTMSGANYLIDNDVDVSNLTEKQIDSLIKRKYIVKLNEGGVVPVTGDNTSAPLLINVPIIEKDSTLEVVLTAEQVVEVFTVLQSTVDGANLLIANIESEDELIVIHQLDSRKGVKELAKLRAEALEKEAEAKRLENADGDSEDSDPNGDDENTDPDAESSNGDGENPDSNGSGEE